MRKDRTQLISMVVPRLEVGGVTGVACNLARQFILKGFMVELVVTQADTDVLSQIPPDVRVVRLGSNKLYRAVFKLAKYFRRSRPDAVIGFTDLANVIAVIAKKLSNVNFQLAISCHMALRDLPLKARRPVHRILPILMRLTYRSADAVIAVSETVADQIAELSNLDRSAITVIQNPVDIDAAIQLSGESVTHPFYAQKIPIILSVGRLVPQKDFQTLIAAFHIILREREARLVILGEGYSRDELESMIGSLGLISRVSMPGFADNPFAYMRRSAVFVLPSLTEAFGLVLVEALACGCRIVSTSASEGPKFILDNGRFGRLVPPGDAKKMAAAILAAFVDEVEPEVLLCRAREISDSTKCAELYLCKVGLCHDDSL